MLNTNFSVISGITDELLKEKIDYIFLRKFKEKEINLSNDIDLLIEYKKINHAKNIIINFFNRENFKIALIQYHANLSFDIYAYRIFEDKTFSINIEVMNQIVLPIYCGISSIDIPYLETESIIKSRIHYKKFNILNKNDYIIHLLHLVLNENKPYYINELKENLNIERINFLKSKWFRKRYIEFLIELKNDNLSNIYLLKKEFQRKIIKNYIKKFNFKKLNWQIEHFLFSIKFKIQNFINPKGLFIVFLGPDGIGKTTIADNLQKKLFKLTKKSLRIHMGNRPKFLDYRKLIHLFSNSKSFQTQNNCSKPKKIIYKKQSKNILKILYSIFRSLLHFFDFIYEYYLIIRPHLSKSTNIISERYFYDYAIINKRFPNTPKIIHHLLAKLIPKPDLIFVVKTDSPDKYVKRKNELELNFFIEEMNSYVSNMNIYSDIKLINNIDCCEDIVFNKVWEEVLNTIHLRNI